MKAHNETSLRNALKNDRGQVLPWVAFMMLLFLGMGAFVLDIGHAFVCYRQLQAATDAAALAGAKEIYYSTSAATAAAYGAISGGQNTYSTLQGVSMVPGYPVTECLSTIANMGILCEGPNNANAIQVKEQAVIPTFFAQVLGIKQMTLTATSTAAKGSPVPLNVALIIDTTLSMNSYDSDCGNTQLGCALNGAQTLLAGLAPTIDPVSVFTFPNIQPPSTANQSNDTQCAPPQSASPGFPGSAPNAPGLAMSLPYSLPTVPTDPTTGYVVPAGYGSYQVTSYSKGYRSSNGSQTPAATDPLVMTVGAPSVNGSAALTGCLAPPNNAGIYGTYLAGVIYAAQASLASEQAAEIASNPTSAPTPVNIMIILSDGDSNASTAYGWGNQFFQPGVPLNNNGVYPSYVNDCQQAVTAGGVAKAAGTQIFTIAYGSPATGLWNGDVNSSACPTDQSTFFSQYGITGTSASNISPCQTMMNIASPDTPQVTYFYSDYNQSGSYSQCYPSSTTAPTAITNIFSAIVGNLSKARLIPDGTT